jgi:hypothetical protein
MSGQEVPPFDLAAGQVGVGNNEAAIATLQNAVASGKREIPVVQLKVESLWDPLRADPRFQELIRKVGFP